MGDRADGAALTGIDQGTTPAPERFRVSSSRYPAGTLFSGLSRAARQYILSGACSFAVGTSAWELRAGDIADTPEGEFEFRVLGHEPAEFVTVWELPPEFWGKAPDVPEESATHD
jgi:hypothetical protein